MVQAGTNNGSASSVEQILRAELAQSDMVLGSIGPILRNLLANDDISLFSDEIVARVRGMFHDLARQLLMAYAEEAGAENPFAAASESVAAVAESLLGNPVLLGHVHAQALEWQLTERLHVRNGFDPALSPLLQAQIAATDPSVSETAMATLAAQVRFLQQARRMELPLGELPGDLFQAALQVLRAHAGEADADGDAVERALVRLRGACDERGNRLVLLSRVVTDLGSNVRAALAVDHAGVAIFLSALALGSGQDRDLTVLSTNDRQLARLALALRAAGLKRDQVEAQFVYLHPGAALPEGFDGLRADSAVTLLASADVVSEG
jgi:hypothetical protein